MGQDGSQMVEGTFCYLASRVLPLADDLHLVCARSADNLDPSTACSQNAGPTFTHCAGGERCEPFSHQAWTARNLRIRTMPWILLRPSACFSPPSRYVNLQHAGRLPTQFYCWKTLRWPTAHLTLLLEENPWRMSASTYSGRTSTINRLTWGYPLPCAIHWPCF